MFKTLIEKELKEIIGSTRFAVTFGVCACLIVLAFYVGARNYQISQTRYEAAIAENFRQMEGITEWLNVNHHIYLPPNPVSSLVTGISNDIGRNIQVQGLGELRAEDSRFNNDPLFAVFRFLDLDFIFQIILSLFAILFAYNAICGEKEQGTLRLTFANGIPKDKYILGKISGSFLALALPLLIPILIGCLLLPIMGIPMSSQDWGKLALVILAGYLYFGIFLSLSVWVSGLTHRSSNAFLLLLVIWIFSVLILPRSAVLIAGRAVDVISVDEISAQKSVLNAQIWREDRDKMNEFKPSEDTEIDQIMQDFQKMMQDLSAERDQRMRELGGRLAEQRRNEQSVQERLAFSLARLSPSAAFSLAVMNLAGTSIDLKQHFLDAASAYQQSYASFMREKTGGTLKGGGMVMVFRRDGDDVTPKEIDPQEIPVFQYQPPSVATVFNASFLDFGLLALFNILFFAGAYTTFLRYDVR